MQLPNRRGGFSILKLLGGVAGAFVLLIVLGAVTVYLRSNATLRQTFAVNVQPVRVPVGADAVARGKHLAETRGCTECHGADLGGQTVFDNGAMGRVDAPNLTRGAGGVPAAYRDEDYVRAIRHGVAPGGRGLFLMPSTDYANFSDDDMGALVAFIKSVPPVDRPRGPIALGPVARALVVAGKIKLAAEEIDHGAVKAAVVTPGVTAEYGRYLANACAGCHGPNFSGGKIAVGPPDWPPAANLTPHAEGSLAKWTEADFIATLRTARRPDGRELHSAMPRVFAKLDDAELKALWLFLQTLPATATGMR